MRISQFFFIVCLLYIIIGLLVTNSFLAFVFFSKATFFLLASFVAMAVDE